MIINILKIRLLQAYRNIKDIGLFRILFLIFLFIFFNIFIFHLLKDSSNGLYVVLVQLFTIISIQVNRKDKSFIKIIFEKPYTIYFFEYLLFSFPILIFCIYHHQFYLLIYQVIGVFLISLIPSTITKKSRNNFLIRLIPSECFEIKSGFRRYFWIITPLLFLTAIFSFYIAVVPLFFVLISVLLLDFFQECEPRNILDNCELSPSLFIHRKLLINSKLLFYIEFPLIIAYLFFNLEYCYIVLIVSALTLLVLNYVILLKYSSYQPKIKLSSNSIFGALAIMCYIMPFFIPLIIIILIRNYFKSISTLNFYLDAHN